MRTGEYRPESTESEAFQRFSSHRFQQYSRIPSTNPPGCLFYYCMKICFSRPLPFPLRPPGWRISHRFRELCEAEQCILIIWSPFPANGSWLLIIFKSHKPICYYNGILPRVWLIRTLLSTQDRCSAKPVPVLVRWENNVGL